MNQVPFIVDVMQRGDIIKKRYIVWLDIDTACAKEARQTVQLHVLGKSIYDPEVGDTIVAEPVKTDSNIWEVW
jgi:hypothetical protein